MNIVVFNAKYCNIGGVVIRRIMINMMKVDSDSTRFTNATYTCILQQEILFSELVSFFRNRSRGAVLVISMI